MQRVFIAAIFVDRACEWYFGKRVFIVAPICGVGLGVDVWLTAPAAVAAVGAEILPAGAISRGLNIASDALIAVVVYRIVKEQIMHL